MPPLKNSRHERFAQFVDAGNADAEAYRLAGFSPKAAQQSACRLRANAGIVERIRELQAKRAAKHDVTKDGQVRFLKQVQDETVIRKVPVQEGIRAAVEISKLCGFYPVEKKGDGALQQVQIIINVPPPAYALNETDSLTGEPVIRLKQPVIEIKGNE